MVPNFHIYSIMRKKICPCFEFALYWGWIRSNKTRGNILTQLVLQYKGEHINNFVVNLFMIILLSHYRWKESICFQTLLLWNSYLVPMKMQTESSFILHFTRTLFVFANGIEQFIWILLFLHWWKICIRFLRESLHFVVDML